MLARLALVIMSLGFAGIARADNPKGWELYSWTDTAAKHKTQYFSVLPGTNRRKTVAEIKRTPLQLAELEQQLARLNKGEQVFWGVGEVQTSDLFELPDAKSDVVSYIGKLGLKLTITPRPPNVGVATMTADGTLQLQLRSLPPGPIAETLVTYGRTDPKYKAMLDHLDGLSPGEHKLIPPWPDQQ